MEYPLPQAPTFDQVIADLENEYQLVTNRANNTQNAWYTSTTDVTVTAGTRKYEITDDDGAPLDFYKAMNIVTVPGDTAIDPEYGLDFVELEHYDKEWNWLGQNQGQLFYSSHSSQLAAIYRTMGDEREEIWIELRPTPEEAETYRILYHQGDWWSKVTEAGDLDYGLPMAEFKSYIYALVMRKRLPTAKWCFNEEVNARMAEKLIAVQDDLVLRMEPTIKEHFTSLENYEIIEIDDWGDDQIGL